MTVPAPETKDIIEPACTSFMKGLPIGNDDFKYLRDNAVIVDAEESDS